MAKIVMKAAYLVPSTEVVELNVQTAVLQSVSGMDLNDKGTDDGSHGAQAPLKVF